MAVAVIVIISVGVVAALVVTRHPSPRASASTPPSQCSKCVILRDRLDDSIVSPDPWVAKAPSDYQQTCSAAYQVDIDYLLLVTLPTVGLSAKDIHFGELVQDVARFQVDAQRQPIFENAFADSAKAFQAGQAQSAYNILDRDGKAICTHPSGVSSPTVTSTPGPSVPPTLAPSSNITTAPAPTTTVVVHSESYFAKAKAAYQDGVNTVGGYEQAGPWLKAANDLASGIRSDEDNLGSSAAEKALRNLATLPDAMAKPAQQLEYDVDFSSLNAFFDTPGLYGMSRSPFHVEAVEDLSSYPDARSITSVLSEYFSFLDGHDYQGAYSLLGPDQQKSFTEQQLATNDATSSDSQIVLTAVTPSNQGDDDFADVTFRSHQSAAEGPNGDTCDNWSLQYNMVVFPTGWLIDQTTSVGNESTHSAC